MDDSILLEIKKRKKLILILVCTLTFLALIITGNIFFKNLKRKYTEASVVTQANLEKMIKVNELSTFEAVYNGIAKVTDSKNPKKIKYYVSYEAKVKAGINTEDIEVSPEPNKNNSEITDIVITLPEIKITEINVDISTLDYIFVDKKANTQTVSEEAYRKCLEDVTNESKNESAIKELAEENAKNIIKALTEPFLKQLGSKYSLKWGNEK